MVVSVHAAWHPAASAARTALAMRRRTRELESAPGLRAGRQCFTTNLLLPVAGRSALLCGWDDASSADRFREESPLLAGFTRGARSVAHVRFEIAHAHGTWHDWRPETARRLDDDEPLAAFVYARLRPSQAATFYRNNVAIVRFARSLPGFAGGLSLHESPLRFGSFSLWNSFAAERSFAYGQGRHKPILKPAATVPWHTDVFSARLRPMAASGGWDPMDSLLGEKS